MHLTREQIASIIQKVGQPDASILLNRFFFKYSNKLTSQDVAELYDEQYFKIINNHPTYHTIEGQYKINIYNRYSFDYIKPKIKSDSTLLDLGCGNGDFVLAVATLGLKLATGVDHSKTAIDSARERARGARLPCNFHNKDISSFSSTERFDFIVLNDITEHLSDSELDILFDKLSRLLEPSGEIIIHTPNGLALCHQTDFNFLSRLNTIYLKIFRNWKGKKRTIEQIYYDQVHINIKSYSQLNSFLLRKGFSSKIYYDLRNSISFIRTLSPNMLVIAQIN